MSDANTFEFEHTDGERTRLRQDVLSTAAATKEEEEEQRRKIEALVDDEEAVEMRRYIVDLKEGGEKVKELPKHMFAHASKLARKEFVSLCAGKFSLRHEKPSFQRSGLAEHTLEKLRSLQVDRDHRARMFMITDAKQASLFKRYACAKPRFFVLDTSSTDTKKRRMIHILAVEQAHARATHDVTFDDKNAKLTYEAAVLSLSAMDDDMMDLKVMSSSQGSGEDGGGAADRSEDGKDDDGLWEVVDTALDKAGRQVSTMRHIETGETRKKVSTEEKAIQSIIDGVNHIKANPAAFRDRATTNREMIDAELRRKAAYNRRKRSKGAARRVAGGKKIKATRREAEAGAARALTREALGRWMEGMMTRTSFPFCGGVTFRWEALEAVGRRPGEEE